jgi:hypothetical protein
MEVYEVVKDMNGDKAPGLDGFPMAFFQSCWDVLRKELMEVFIEFHQWGKFEKSLNATFITFILKRVGIVEVKDFRPISLVSGIYKIIVKILVNRMKAILENIISNTQERFYERASDPSLGSHCQ